ncbi:MAG: ribosome recycling factor [Lachnospiraceae bacterium]|nr:ribosome recycling factor [Lachnospiraceae bacterium]
MDSRFNQFKEKMEKSFTSLKNEFQTIRAGRANPKVLDKVLVDYYGTKTPLNQMANFSVPEARILIVQPFDKSAIKDIVKGINEADIGINPNIDNDVIRLVFPELNEERRKELSKDIKKIGEDIKVSMRNIRRDANDFIKKLEKNNEATEDDVKQFEKDVQKMLDDYIKKVEEAVDSKTNEIMKL